MLSGIAFLVLVAVAGGYVHDAYFASPKDDARAQSFVVPEGSRGIGIARSLHEQGLLGSTIFFRAYLRFSGLGDDLKPGTFELYPGMSYAAMISELTRPETSEVRITIPEGFTLKQIGERVRAALPHVTEDEWNAAVAAPTGAVASRDAAWFLNQVKPPDVDLEGYLFPDTYRFFPDATAADVVTRMVETMSAKLGEAISSVADENDVWKAGTLTTPHEVLTLASVLEREVRSPDDMRDVADIFLSRLVMGMPLQADSTIAYYLGKTSAEMTVEDLRTDEPFNTYTRAGLPPGPISNPGLNAIDAVLHPTENPYLYFLTTSDGTVIYASTFEEHVANKQRYLR